MWSQERDENQAQRSTLYCTCERSFIASSAYGTRHGSWLKYQGYGKSPPPQKKTHHTPQSLSLCGKHFVPTTLSLSFCLPLAGQTRLSTWHQISHSHLWKKPTVTTFLPKRTFWSKQEVWGHTENSQDTPHFLFSLQGPLGKSQVSGCFLAADCSPIGRSSEDYREWGGDEGAVQPISSIYQSNWPLLFQK